MALSFSKLFAAKLVDNAAVDTLFTVGASPTSNLLRNGRIRFANVTAGAVTIKAWAVPAAGAAADANVLLPTLSIAANSFFDVDVPIVAAGGFVQAQAGAASSINASHVDGFIQS
jgi:hypothetical protein